MTSPDTMAGLRLADRSLRRYATHMTGGPVDGILHDAYVSTVRWNEPISSANRASIPLFQSVHEAAVTVAPIQTDGSNDDLESALQSLPVAQRGALLLTALERLTAQDASQVLGIPESMVLEHADTAADAIKERVPAVHTADMFELGRALGDLPVSQASPLFWAQVEADIGSDTTAAFPIDDTLIAEPVLTSTPPPPPEESLWPAIWAGIGAVAVIGLIVVFLVTRSPDDQIAAQAVDSTASTTSAPPTDESSTAPPTSASPTSASPTTQAPTTAAPTTIAPTTAAPTTIAPTSAAPTSTPADNGGAIDRGAVTFQGNLAILEGSLAPGAVDAWRVDMQPGQTLSVAVGGLTDIVFSLHRSDGSTVTADYADSGLQVFSEPGSHTLRFTDRSGSGAGYAVGVGLTPPDFGFLTNLDDQGVAFSTLAVSSCTRTGEQLDATLSSGGVVVTVSVGQETGPGTVAWLGTEEALGEITSISPVPTGLVLVGTITAGRESLLGFPFWLGLYGCEEAS